MTHNQPDRKKRTRKGFTLPELLWHARIRDVNVAGAVVVVVGLVVEGQKPCQLFVWRVLRGQCCGRAKGDADDIGGDGLRLIDRDTRQLGIFCPHIPAAWTGDIKACH